MKTDRLPPFYSIGRPGYPGIAPEHAFPQIRKSYVCSITDEEAAYQLLNTSRKPKDYLPIESAHADAKSEKSHLIWERHINIVCLSGREDKDVAAIARYKWAAIIVIRAEYKRI
jgi:tryptophan synthase beta chain